MINAIRERDPAARPLKSETDRFFGPALTIFALFAFASLFLFYSRVHPLYVHDFDDWLYVWCPRPGYPDPTQWNPTKLLPETVMPLVSYFAAYFVYPISGDYIQALCDTYAVFLSAILVVYLLFTGKLLKKWFSLSDGALTMVLIFFFLSHFLPYLTRPFGNQHLFYSINVTCVFNYLIPGFWNFILCLYFLRVEKVHWAQSGEEVKKGILIFCVYLAIFSSLWHSVILMSLFGTRLLFALIDGIRDNREEKQKAWPFLWNYAKTHAAKLVALAFWFLAILMELTGERAAATDMPFHLGTSVRTCLYEVFSLNRTFLISVALINALAVGLALYRRKEAENGKFLYQQLEIGFSMFLCGTFLVLVGAKVTPDYLERSDVMISWMLWLMLMSVFSLGYLIKKQPKILYILPVLILILSCKTVVRSESFAEHYFYDQTPAVVKAVSSDIVAQIQAADQAGLTEVEVHVPVHGSDGWPLDDVLTPYRIAQALYDHNLTDNCMDVTLVPDPQKDLELHVVH